MRVLVVGGYGLIGSYAVRALAARGHVVIGGGRSVTLGRRLFPDLEWRDVELGVTGSDQWAEILAGVEVVINAAGVLQDGSTENLKASHVTGLEALVAGCGAAGVRRLIHISAAGVRPGRGGGFNDSKAEGEAVVATSGLDWVILRPGLVFAPGAFGGSALLRGLAAFPMVIPGFSLESTVQPVGVHTVAEAIVRCAEVETPSRVSLDLVGAERLRLADLLQQLRRWLGSPPAPVTPIPGWAVSAMARFADALGWLGWRNPMRTNAVQQIGLGMSSPPGGEAALGLQPQTFSQILSSLPSTLQERRFARLYFLKPAALIGVSVFCLATGAITLVEYARSEAILAAGGVPSPLSDLLVVGGALLDVAIGLGLAVHAWASRALIALVVTSFGYLGIASVLRPDLWLDPLGVLTKTILVALLALTALAMMDER